MADLELPPRVETTATAIRLIRRRFGWDAGAEYHDIEYDTTMRQHESTLYDDDYLLLKSTLSCSIVYKITPIPRGLRSHDKFNGRATHSVFLPHDSVKNPSMWELDELRRELRQTDFTLPRAPQNVICGQCSTTL